MGLQQRIGSQLQDSALPGQLRFAEAIELFAGSPIIQSTPMS